MESEHLIGYTIRALSNLFRRQLMSHQPPGGKPCSETAGMIMGYLCEHVGDQLCQHDIEQVFCIRRSTASRFLIALEKEEMIERVSRLAQADPFIQEMPDKYDTYIEQGGTNVSGGQKQRLCIARALLKKPKILILDDSTSAVDTKTDALIRQAFREEIPDTTKFILAQRISSVQDADHILVLDDGHISAYGTHEELLKTSQIYQEVFASQQKGGEEDA